MLALASYSLKPVKLLGTVQTDATMLGIVGTFCVRLHGSLLHLGGGQCEGENKA